MECLNCSSLLEEKNHFLLPKCGHPLCENCLATLKLQNLNELICSTCNIKIPDPNFLSKYLSVYPMMADQTIHQNCVICEESHTATKFCLDCKEAFCDTEARSHCRRRLFNNHVVVLIEELNGHQKAHHHLGFLHHKSCIHHNRPYEFLDLETTTHNELLCTECTTGKNNSVFGLGDCASSLLHEKLEHIRELGSQGTAHLAELRDEEEIFTSRLKSLEESRARSLIEIRRVFGSLHEALQTRQSELEREVEEVSKSAGFALSEERERSRVWQGQLSLLEKCVEEINESPFSHPQSPASPSSPRLKSISTLSPPSSSESSSHFHNSKALVDACLLEDALRSSLSSSRASSTLTDDQSRVRVSEIRDLVDFSFQLLFSSALLTTPRSSPSPRSPSSSSSLSEPLKEADKLDALVHLISTLGSITSTTSTSSPLVSQSDWSKNKVQSVMTFYSQGNRVNQLNSPYGMTYSPDSKLFYVCDSGNHRIQVFRNHPQAEREGRFEIEFLPPLGLGSSSSSSGLAYTAPPSPLRNPSYICYHDGQLFIVDQGNHRVQVWRAKDGSFIRMIGTGSGGKAVGQFANPWGCTVYQNHLFVSEHNNHRIQKFSLSDFRVVKVIGSRGGGLGQLNYPTELSLFNGKLYVADLSNRRVSVFDPESGAALSVIGPSLLNDGNLSRPFGLLSSHNLLFVSSNHRISVFDSDHNYLYSFGSSGSEDGQFSTPCGMVMVNERLFICEFSNSRVQILEQNFDETDSSPFLPSEF